MRQQGVDEAMDIRTDRQAEQAGAAIEESTFGTILEGQAVTIRKNSAGAEVTQPRLNLIEGANIAITLADDPVGSEADITVALSANPDVTTLKTGGNQVIGARKTGWGNPAGTLSRAAYTAYTGQTISNPPTQAEAQALDDAVKLMSQTLAAILTDIHTATSAAGGHKLISA